LSVLNCKTQTRVLQLLYRLDQCFTQPTFMGTHLLTYHILFQLLSEHVLKQKF